jgi:hypothetical protein
MLQNRKDRQPPSKLEDHENVSRFRAESERKDRHDIFHALRKTKETQRVNHRLSGLIPVGVPQALALALCEKCSFA